MSLKLNVTAQATEDAIRIADFLADRASLNTSDKFLNATTRAYRQLAEMPGMGRLRNYGQNFFDLHMWPVPQFPNHLIFYRADETQVTILRVLHGAQNIEQIFSDPEDD